jgi:hypothetical protein
MLVPAKITRTVTPILNGEFDVVSLSRDQHKADRLVSKANYIAVLPFDCQPDGKIQSVYGLKFENHATGQKDVTLLTDSFDQNRDKTTYDSIIRLFLEEAGINLDEAGITEDDIFYLGNITSAVPVNSRFKCFAVDLTRITGETSKLEFTRNLSKSNFEKDSSEIVKIGFKQVVNGDFSDSMILSGSFLLVSYFG